MIEKQKNKKQKILKTSASLFSKRGYFGVSMDEIAEEVGVAKSALYYHFKSKEDLCKELMRISIKELKREIKDVLKKSCTPVDTVFNIIKVFLEYTLRHPEINLLTSLDVSTDKKLPIAQFIIDLRMELVGFIREIIVSLDIARRKTRKYTFLMARSLVGLILNPFLLKDIKSKELSSHLTSLLISQNKMTVKSK